MEPASLHCIIPFNQQLIAGERYPFLTYDARQDRVRVIDRRGRWRWYPADHFVRVPATSPDLVSFTLDDPIHDPHLDCIEVTVELAGGQRRWCFFATPRWLSRALPGETEPKLVEKEGLALAQLTMLDTPLVTGEGVPFRMIGVPHLLIVSELTEAVVAATLGHLAGQGDLRRCTRLLRRRPRRPGSPIMPPANDASATT